MLAKNVEHGIRFGVVRAAMVDDSGERSEAGPALNFSPFYARLHAEMERREWTKVQFYGRFLGIPGFYKWTERLNDHDPAVPDTETIVRIAIKLGWSLDTLLRGVSPEYDAVAERERQRQIEEAVSKVLAARSDSTSAALVRSEPSEGPALPSGVLSNLLESSVSSHPSDLSQLFHYIASLPYEDLSEAKQVLERWRARKLLTPETDGPLP